MKMDTGKLRTAMRVVGLVGACVFLLGPVVFGMAASAPNSRRDVLIDFPSDVAATTAADRTLVAEAQLELKKDESFTNETKVVEYRFRLDNSSDMVHLSVSAEVEHGVVRWELIDPPAKCAQVSGQRNEPTWKRRTFRPSRANGCCA